MPYTISTRSDPAYPFRGSLTDPSGYNNEFNAKTLRGAESRLERLSASAWRDEQKNVKHYNKHPERWNARPNPIGLGLGYLAAVGLAGLGAVVYEAFKKS